MTKLLFNPIPATDRPGFPRPDTAASQEIAGLYEQVRAAGKLEKISPADLQTLRTVLHSLIIEHAANVASSFAEDGQDIHADPEKVASAFNSKNFHAFGMLVDMIGKQFQTLSQQVLTVSLAATGIDCTLSRNPMTLLTTFFQPSTDL
jgi:hypothetical protein